jgi:hypothetical protein
MGKLLLALLISANATATASNVHLFRIPPSESCIEVVESSIINQNLKRLIVQSPRTIDNYTVTEFGAINDHVLFIFQCFKFKDSNEQFLRILVSPKNTL